MALRLRETVELRPSENGFLLVDHMTGAEFELEGDCHFLTAPADLQKGHEAEWAILERLALLQDASSDEEIIRRQREARTELGRSEKLERLHALLQFCVDKVPFYRERKEVYDPKAVPSLEVLATLPLIEKSDLRTRVPEGMLAEDFDLAGALASKRVELAATSGTTGERLQAVVDFELASVPGNYAKIWGIAEVEGIPRTAVFTSPLCTATECHLGKLPMKERIREDYTLYLNSLDDLFSLKAPLIDGIAGELAVFRPQLLLTNPVYLHHLALEARRLGKPLPFPELKVILASYQYLSGLQRRGIEQLLGVPIRGYYAATDLGGSRLGIECHRGHLHVREDQSLIELVGHDGPRALGELGALAVTTLASRVMPLVRYRVGDIGRFVDVQCDCGAKDWPVLELHGRSKDMIWVDGRWLTTREVDQAVSQVEGLDFYRCVQAGEEVRLEVVAAPTQELSTARIAQQVSDLLHAPRVVVKRIRRLDPEPSMKFRFTQSQTHSPPELPSATAPRSV